MSSFMKNVYGVSLGGRMSFGSLQGGEGVDGNRLRAVYMGFIEIPEEQSKNPSQEAANDMVASSPPTLLQK